MRPQIWPARAEPNLDSESLVANLARARRECAAAGGPRCSRSHRSLLRATSLHKLSPEGMLSVHALWSARRKPEK